MALYAFAQGVAPGQTPLPMGQMIDIGGRRLHLYCVGEGSPTVLISGGYSFDWALVQPSVSKLTRVCTYDTAGTAWSDPGPNSTCSDRVDEIHKLVAAAPITKPFILVGFSIGGLVARRYAFLHPADVAAMVFVDHAFLPRTTMDYSVASNRPDTSDRAPVLIEKTPIIFSTEETSNFEKLPLYAKKLHRWAKASRPRADVGPIAEDCVSQIENAERQPHPLGSMPLIVVSWENDLVEYKQLQQHLLSLSTNSKQLVSSDSFHSIEIDDPEIVVSAIRTVVDAARAQKQAQ